MRSRDHINEDPFNDDRIDYESIRNMYFLLMFNNVLIHFNK